MVRLESVSVSYQKDLEALKDVSLSIEKGEFVAIVGLSGSGKSTLLRTINFLTPPSKGDVYVDGAKISSLSKKKLKKVRAKIGLIFQDYNLVDKYSVFNNVLLGRLAYTHTLSSILGLYSASDHKLTEENILKVGLKDKMFQRVDRLSGGQKQRVSIARALTQNPNIILADEPVSSLDIATAESVMDYLVKFNKKRQITVIVNLHDINLAKKYASRVVGLRDGKVVFDNSPTQLTNEMLHEIYY
ncbi:phosphonate ABC transporter ATP-binding protein [Proteinivorax hydrogeniformans]|uniref:Phosphonate ABC transporter ATP-binding protein n=1 Tax=Proteinivorax hydrogeniformans TaxID=1826727 RepID=A0AAU8HSY2_9FIRM